MSELTTKQKRFVEEFMIDLNGTKAAIRAGYSEKGAHVQAAQLLSNPKVTEAVAEAKTRVADRIGRSVRDVMADIGRVRDDAMQQVEDQRTGALMMLSHKDALKALELEGKHLGAFQDRIDVTNSDGTLAPKIIKIVGKK